MPCNFNGCNWQWHWFVVSYVEALLCSRSIRHFLWFVRSAHFAPKWLHLLFYSIWKKIKRIRWLHFKKAGEFIQSPCTEKTDNIVSFQKRNYVKMPKSTKYYGKLLIFQCDASSSKTKKTECLTCVILLFGWFEIQADKNSKLCKWYFQPILLTKCASHWR